MLLKKVVEKLPYRTNFILDEFANMPPLKMLQPWLLPQEVD